VTCAELVFGLEKRGNPRALSRRVHGFLDRVTVVSWDAAAADRFAELRAKLERAGTPIGIFDTMIGSRAGAQSHAGHQQPQAFSKSEGAQGRELGRGNTASPTLMVCARLASNSRPPESITRPGPSPAAGNVADWHSCR
jgi:hypothetical protein